MTKSALLVLACSALLVPAVLSPAYATDPSVRALESLAAKGSARAQYELGVRYETGRGVHRDFRRAHYYHCLAARQDHASGAFHAALLHLSGKGGAGDEGLAHAWMRRAASLGHDGARARAGGAAKAGRPESCGPPRPSALGPLAPPPREIRQLVHKHAPTFGLDPALVLAVIAAESSYQADVVSPKSAMGLMQLIPATAERFGVANPMDPEQNVKGGMKYLRWLLAYFRGDVTLALAAYNAGEGAVLQHRGVPPYDETRAYLERIRTVYTVRRHPFDPDVVGAATLAPGVPYPAPRPERRPDQEEVAELTTLGEGVKEGDP